LVSKTVPPGSTETLCFSSEKTHPESWSSISNEAKVFAAPEGAKAADRADHTQRRKARRPL